MQIRSEIEIPEDCFIVLGDLRKVLLKTLDPKLQSSEGFLLATHELNSARLHWGQSMKTGSAARWKHVKESCEELFEKLVY